MKILIGGAPSKFFHLREFGDALVRNGIEYKLVSDIEFVIGFPNKDPLKWKPNLKKFNELISNFEPDIVFCDRPQHFALETIKKKIPLYLHLRGNYWEEMDWASKTMYKTIEKRFALWWRKRIAEKCFQGSTKILPISKFLKKIVRKYYPDKSIQVLYGGIESKRWYRVPPMELKHPCVGLLQGAHIWGKTVEMLSLEKAVKDFPKITFYWAGDGPYKDIILKSLGKYENFKWLGNLAYPDDVRKFLSGIDVYALISGMDQSPLTIQEAALMEKPTIATNAGGIPELMMDGKTGYLVTAGDQNDLKEKISMLINDGEKCHKMGLKGREFIKENFNWDKITRDFISSINQ